MTLNDLARRHALLLQDEAKLHARLHDLDQERADLATALQRTTGARLECEHWMTQIQREAANSESQTAQSG